MLLNTIPHAEYLPLLAQAYRSANQRISRQRYVRLCGQQIADYLCKSESLKGPKIDCALDTCL